MRQIDNIYILSKILRILPANYKSVIVSLKTFNQAQSLCPKLSVNEQLLKFMDSKLKGLFQLKKYLNDFQIITVYGTIIIIKAKSKHKKGEY
jgi:hypothetical protein